MAFLVVIVLVVVLVISVAAALELGQLRRQLHDHETRLAALSQWLEALQRAARLGPSGVPEPQAPPARLAEDLRPSPAAHPAPPPPTPAPSAPLERPRPFVPERVSEPVRVEAPRPRLDWESLISVRGFAWLGGVALFLGAALFLHYAIQHGWITPSMRVAIGVAVGTAALVLGERLRAKAEWSGQATSGAGVAILYASLYAAAMLYKLVPMFVAFVGMTVVTIVAGIIAVKRRTILLALLGVTGGFLTPPLLSTGEDHPLVLLSYVLLLDVGVIAVARRRDWREIQLLAIFGTSALYVAWAAQFLTPGRVIPALLAAALLAALFAFLSALEERTEPAFGLPEVIPALAVVAPLALAAAVADRPYFAVPTGFLVPYLLLLSTGALFVSRRIAQPALLAVTAAFCAITLVMRVGKDLFPGHRTETLILDALIPIFFFSLWRVQRASAHEKECRVAAAITIIGSYFLVAAILAVEPRTEPMAGLVVFCALHAALLLAMAASLRSGRWTAAAAGYWLICVASVQIRFDTSRLSEFLPHLLVPIAVFGSLPLVSERFRSDRLPWLASAVVAVVQYVVLYVSARDVWGKRWLGAVALLLAALAFAGERAAKRLVVEETDRRPVSLTYGGLAATLVAVAAANLLEKEWLTIAFAAEAAALAWLSRRIAEPAVIVGSWTLAGAALIRLVVNQAIWTYHPRTGVPILNWYLYAFAGTAASFVLASRWVSTNSIARSIYYPQSLLAAAGLLVFMLVNVEIADLYSSSETLSFRLTGGGLAQDMTYSLAWGIYALVILVLGIRKRSKATRAAALVVFLLTIGKVFLHDLWDLGSLYRVASIVGLAIALLAVSYLTQRFVFAREKA